MPIQYQRDDLNRRVIVTTAEPVTSEELIALTKQQAEEGAWSYALLYDATAGHEPPSREDDSSTSCTLPACSPQSTGAVGPSRWCCRILICGGWENAMRRSASWRRDSRVFTTVREAEEWLSEEAPLTLSPPSQ